jgi:hypothetical protein
MKEANIILDRDEIEEILREHLAGMFPALEISTITGLGYSDVTVRLRKPFTAVEPAPAPEPFPITRPAAPVTGGDEVQF